MIFWQFLSIFGDIQFWVGAAITSLIFFFAIPKRAKKHVSWFIFLTLPTVLIAYSVIYVIKLLFKVPRPCFGLLNCPLLYSFPSGHAAVVFAAMTSLALLYKNKKLAIILLLSSCLVSLSRLFLNVHRVEDVVIGSLIGIVVGVLIERVYEMHQKEIKEIITKMK